MRCSLAILAAAVLGQSALATPVTSSVSSIAASLPVSELDLGPPTLVASGTALPAGILRPTVGPHPDEIDIVLLLCELNGCQDCTLVDLMGVNANMCFSQNFVFTSVAVIQPNAPDLPFNTSVGTLGCGALLQLPAQNQCFNVNGATFQSWALVIDDLLH